MLNNLNEGDFYYRSKIDVKGRRKQKIRNTINNINYTNRYVLDEDVDDDILDLDLNEKIYSMKRR